MADRYLERLARAADETGEAGLDAVLVTPSPDLLYLTGYDPPPLERLTLLVLTPGGDPALLVPVPERRRAADSPVAGRLEVAAWSDGEDAYAAAAGLLPGGAPTPPLIGCGPHTSSASSERCRTPRSSRPRPSSPACGR